MNNLMMNMMNTPARMNNMMKDPTFREKILKQTMKLTETPEGIQNMINSVSDPYIKAQMRATLNDPLGLNRARENLKSEAFDSCLSEGFFNGTPNEMYQCNKDREGVPADFFYCLGCGDSFKLSQKKRCSNCKVAVYCSVNCQRKHWTKTPGGHRVECQSMKKSNKIGKKTGGGKIYLLDHNDRLESLHSAFSSLPPGFSTTWFTNNPYHVRAKRLFNKGMYIESIPLYLKSFPLGHHILVDHLIKKVKLPASCVFTGQDASIIFSHEAMLAFGQEQKYTMIAVLRDIGFAYSAVRNYKEAILFAILSLDLARTIPDPTNKLNEGNNALSCAHDVARIYYHLRDFDRSALASAELIGFLPAQNIRTFAVHGQFYLGSALTSIGEALFTVHAPRVHLDEFQSFEQALCNVTLTVRPEMLEKIAPVLVRCVPFTEIGWAGLLKRLTAAEKVRKNKGNVAEREKLILIVKKRIDCEKSFKQRKKNHKAAAAKHNDADTQFDLGVMYLRTAEHDKAVKCFKSAGEQGHVGALYNLGNKYARGEGVVQSFEKAIKYWKKAGSGNDVSGAGAEAIANVAVMYRDGTGVKQSYETAAMYFEQAGKNKSFPIVFVVMNLA